MKPFVNRILVCLVPILVAGLVVGRASMQYARGEGGFKFGVDLVGGTILVYQIDVDKLGGQTVKGEELAAAIKRRIDPADLLTVVVRPLSDTRVEIIFPSGGAYQARVEADQWDKLLDAVAGEWSVVKKENINLERGSTGQLAGYIEKEIEKAAWGEFVAGVRKQWPKQLEPVKPQSLEEIPRSQLRDYLKKQGIDEKEISAFFDKNLRSYEDKLVKVEVISTFIQERYRPGGGRKSATGEEVQRIKDLIAQVGSLEFRILANERDDKAAIEAARTWFASINDPNQPQERRDERRRTLEDLARRGLPPPRPGDGALFDWKTDWGEGKASYIWVELSKEARHDLHLNNAARESKDQQARTRWNEVAKAREAGTIFKLGDFGESVIWSRPCINDNLRPEQRNDKQFDYFILTREVPKDERVTGDYLVTAQEDTDQQLRPAVSFTFNNRGATLFHALTSANRPSGSEGGGRFFRHLGIILDDQLVSAPTLREAIRDRGQISGGFTHETVQKYVRVLRSGKLPATLNPNPVSENTIGPTLGEDTIRAGTMSVLFAFIAVLVFMLGYYRFAGLVACIALFANLLLTIGFMVLVNATFTLPGLAGLVLMLAMAVDANVLIYERIREERERGASLPLAIRNGYDRAFPTIIDTHLTSILTAIILYAVGNDQLKGFGVSLTAGLIISLFTSLYMTRLMFDIWQAMGWLKQLRMLRILSRPNIDFMGIRYQVFTVSIICALLGGTLFLLRGRQGLNIDFTGGTAYTARLREPLDIGRLRELLAEDRQQERLRVKEDGVKERDGGRGQSFDITYEDGSRELIELPNPAPGSTPSEREANVKARAQLLPDWSVEPIFLSSETYEGNQSKWFNVRTSEKAPELVQVVLDRLLIQPDDAGKPVSLLEKIELKDFSIGGQRALLEFAGDELAAPDEVKAVVEKEARAMKLDLGFAVRGEGSAKGGRFSKIWVEATGSTAARLPADTLKTLMDSTQKALADSGKDGRKLEVKHVHIEGRRAWLEFSKFGENKPEVASPSQVKTLIERLANRVFNIDLKNTTFDVVGEGQNQEGRYQKMRVEVGYREPGKVFPSDILKDILQQTQDAFRNRPQPERLENFDSQLATDTQTRALYAILASWCAVLLYLWFRFGNWTFGLAAVICLIHDVLFTLGLIALCHYIVISVPPLANLLALQDFKIDLPAVASILTLIGFSVNDTIVVFDRIREVRGKNPELTPWMINDSINQTLSRTVLTSFIAWLVVLVLYIWGGDGVHLFSFVMVVGVIIGTYSSIYVASPLLLIFREGQVAPAPGGRPSAEPPPEQEKEEEEPEEAAVSEQITAKPRSKKGSKEKIEAEEDDEDKDKDKE
jgi:SecD/SecF fusion protein